MKDGTYITIQSWMRTELDLKGNDLIVYAIIFGFSQTENTRFTGSLQYLADWCGATKQGILKNIKNLLDRGLIEKNEEIKNGIKFVEYYATKLNTPLNKVEYPIKQSLTNNIDNKHSNKNSNSKELELQNSEKPKFEFGKSKTPQPSLSTKCVNLIDDYVSRHNCGNPVREKLIEYLRFRLEVKDKPLYINMWKGMLNKLDALHKEGYGYIPIIDHCIEKGYLSFYPPAKCYTDTNNKSWDDGVSCEQYTEEELQKLDVMQKDMEAKGMRTKF